MRRKRCLDLLAVLLLIGAGFGLAPTLSDRAMLGSTVEILAMRGGDSENKALRMRDCSDVNTGSDEVGWLNCPSEGVICIQCRGDSERTYVTGTGPNLQTPGIHFIGMQSCHGDKLLGYCVRTELGLICVVAAISTGECNGEINVGLQQSQTPPGSGD